MFSILTNRVAADIATIKATVAVHDQVRSIVWPERGQEGNSPNQSSESSLGAIQQTAPELLPWRIYDHCAAFTRLYAVYEQFVFELLKEWLAVLPQVYLEYSSLPDSIRDAHRIGVADILQKLGGDRYSHLSECDVLRGISSGSIDGTDYSLLFDAYTIDDRNLWRESLQRMFKKVGIEKIWNWVANHSDVRRFLQDARGESSTADSELHGFVFARNEAAHGVVDNIVSTVEFEKVADFVSVLCHVLAEAVHKAFIDRKFALGEATTIGAVIRQFRDRVVGVELTTGAVSVGDDLVIVRDQACYSVEVERIEINRVSYQRIEIENDINVGLQLSRTAKINSQVVVCSSK